jgi:hypothetical protein
MVPTPLSDSLYLQRQINPYFYQCAGGPYDLTARPVRSAATKSGGAARIGAVQGGSVSGFANSNVASPIADVRLLSSDEKPRRHLPCLGRYEEALGSAAFDGLLQGVEGTPWW